MKKHLLAFLFLPLLAFAFDDWISVQLDDRVSINFPSQPMMQESNGNKIWIKDVSGGRCMAMVIDFAKFGMDSATLATEMNKPESFEQFKTTFLNQVQGAMLVSEKNSVHEGRRVFEFVITMGNSQDTSGINKTYNKNIFVANKMYSMSFYENDKKPQPELKKKFFNSIKIK